jgi:hypothetical protein
VTEAIKERYFHKEDTVVLEISVYEAEKAGFRVVHERNKIGGAFYWHLYRDVERGVDHLPISVFVNVPDQ